MRIALDTNILAHAEGVNGAAMRTAALELIDELPAEITVVPVQTLGELFNVLTRKAGQTSTHARDAIINWRDAFPIIETSVSTIEHYLPPSLPELSTRHLGRGNTGGGCRSALSAFALGRSTRRFHLEWRYGG